MLRILHPGMFLTIFLPLLSTAALVYIFVIEWQETVPAYIVYGLSVYSLTILVLDFPKLVAKIKGVIHKNKFGSRYMTDVSLRVKISLYASLAFNLIYAVSKLIAGIHYASFWYGADAIYYIVLSVARFLLLHHMQKDDNNLKSEFRKYRICGILIFILNIAMIGVIYQIVNHGMGYSYPGLLIYAVATYTFYCITISIINVVRYRKYKNPVYSAGKALSLTKALVSMFALQTAMFASFNDDIALERTMNLIVGIAVCFSIFCLAVFMVIRANNNLKILSINNSETKLKHFKNK